MKHKLLSVFVFLLVATMYSYGQRTISGVVTSAKDKQPLIGAIILVEKTSIGTSTDIDGKYSLAIPDSAKNIVVSYTGMKTKTLPILGSSIDIVLEENEKVLEDVVVTAQAVKREKRSLGYATTTVNSEDLNQASPVSALDALQGKVAGAQITNVSGAPGGSTRVVLRGGSSLTGDNNALIVVDGVPIDNSNFGFADVLNNGYDAGNRANDINPEDVESVTVLKGAAAVALYGQRGANGAILYTTKSGKSKGDKEGRRFKVTLSEDITAETPLKLPTMQNQFGQGSEDNYGNAYFDTRQNWSWGPAFNGQNMYWGTPVVQPNGSQLIQIKPYSAIPNNFSSFFNTGATYNTNLSIQGGDNSSSYYASFNNVKYDGIVPTTGYERNSLRLNASHDFGDKITITGSFNYTNTNSVLPVSGQGVEGIYQLLLNTPRDIPMQEIRNLNSPFNAPNQYYDPFVPNPYWALQEFKTTDNVDRFLTNLNAEWRPTKWLTIVERFGADIYTDTREQDWNSYSFNPIYYYQGLTTVSPTAASYIGKFDQDRYTVDNINSDLMATLHKDIRNWTFSLLLGNNIYSNTLKNTYGETNGLAVPGVYNFSNSTFQPTLTNQTAVTRLLAGYGDLNIGYKNFIFLELTGRNDWSSALPLDNRSYFYPGAGASFVFTEVGKKKINPMILSFGKIRANIAQIGTTAPPYSLTNYFVPGGISDGYSPNTAVNTPYYTMANSNVPGWAQGTTINNPDLKPELSTTWEVGTELGFLKDRLTVDATYYYKKTVNEILSVPIAPSTGYTNEVINAGVLQNQGVELAVHIVPVQTKSFKWEVYGTYTKNISKVLQISNNASQIVLGGTSAVAVVAQKGQPLGSFYGSGVQTDGKGHVVVDSGVGTPLLSTNPSVLGSYQPTWLGSIGTKVSYKGITLTILFDGRDGGQFYSSTAILQQFLGNGIQTAYNDRQPFVAPNSVYEGTGANAGYHTNTTKTGAFNYWYAVSTIPSYQIISASFVKIREIALTYAIPAKKLASQKAIKAITLKAFASNVWLWVPKSNTFGDPEVGSSGTGNVQGFEIYNIPSVRSFGGGFTVEF